ncbi:ferritin-like domain-containing protein [Variovorax sp. CAN2819]|uniref:ferritin-like domain-containing protein n=1 Tax=Variovorax sp. CAN15 TaxID=3046727 RepID=UPI002648EA00|nr:ferritin-like domain-containing protein [Variovorax sp. CAN15]MDN6882554.1 ferritin-like domain-containing protein [Variovorax sp. CAN15]
MAASPTPTIDIESLGLDQGALLLIRRALAERPAGGELRVRGRSPDWRMHLEAWCRSQGHALRFDAAQEEALVTRGPHAEGRWLGAQSTGDTGDVPAEDAASGWGLAARGATVEAGSPPFFFALHRRDELWAATAGELYRQAAAAQWDPATAIDWDAPFELPGVVEAAVVQVMTYLIENENAALLVPARHLGQIHPHFREVLQLLALQCADEARHVEVFTRRATLRGHQPALSTAGGQASLRTLFDAPDFSVATFLLAVLGEGSFVNLLNFLHAHAPDPVTRQIARLAARDEARHVAFGMAHLEYRLSVQPDYQVRLRNAIELRYDTLAGTAGLNEEVFDSLVLLAAGELSPAAVARGHAAVRQLQRDMAAGRRARLSRLGFGHDEAQRLAELHTRNFM